MSRDIPIGSRWEHSKKGKATVEYVTGDRVSGRFDHGGPFSRKRESFLNNFKLVSRNEPIDMQAELDRLRAELEAERARVADLVVALAWYGEQARLARLIHSEGDSGRNALDNDGGQKARAALSRTPAQSRAEIEAGALERFAQKAEIEYYSATGDITEWPEVIGDIKREAARLRSEAKEQEDGNR